MQLLLLFLWAFALPNPEPPVSTPLNPLVDFDPVWNHTKYNACNTAKNIPYLTTQEKEIIFVLNLVRQYPAQFNRTIVAYWPEYLSRPGLKTNKYYTSLVADLDKMKPVGLLKPDSLAWISARCHAYTSGKKGYLGHERQTASCKSYFSGECCHYGGTDPLEIIMDLLIDEDIESLGHRIISLDGRFKAIGVSFQYHQSYGYNTVLDFTY